MKRIAIITGGAGGMGLATAELLGRDHHVVVSDKSQEQLDSAVAELRQKGISCDSVVCDVTDRASVDRLASMGEDLGEVASVIHTAGISPQMAGPEAILRVNALGTVNITEAFHEIATDDFALVNVASMAAYMLPGFLIPTRAYRHAFSDPEAFLKKMLFRCRLMPKEIYRTGMAYSLSKNFVVWYSKVNAARFGHRNARILSVSPGTFDTEMGRLEERSGSMKLLDQAALKRPGGPGEIAEVLAFCASQKASYMTGVDILCDGGVIASRAG